MQTVEHETKKPQIDKNWGRCPLKVMVMCKGQRFVLMTLDSQQSIDMELRVSGRSG